ncbi:hypothetical protein QQ045_023322 [Rhodiola kirilowii]
MDERRRRRHRPRISVGVVVCFVVHGVVVVHRSEFFNREEEREKLRREIGLSISRLQNQFYELSALRYARRTPNLGLRAITTKERKRKSQNSNEIINNAEAVAGKGRRKKVKICETQLNVVSKVNTTANNSDSDFEDSNSHQPVAQLSMKQVQKLSTSSKNTTRGSASASTGKLEDQGKGKPRLGSKVKGGRKSHLWQLKLSWLRNDILE